MAVPDLVEFGKDFKDGCILFKSVKYDEAMC